jgi:hypothetical protein
VTRKGAPRLGIWAIATFAACNFGAGIGGPVDQRWPPEKRVLKELPGARVVALTSHLHYAGEKAGCTSHTESGCGMNGASPGDEYIVDVNVEVPGRAVLVDHKPVAEGIHLVGRHRIATAEAAEGFAKLVQLETCAAGQRVAVRARLDDSEEWALVDLAGNRWGSYSFKDPCAVVAERGEPLVWNELSPEKTP